MFPRWIKYDNSLLNIPVSNHWYDMFQLFTFSYQGFLYKVIFNFNIKHCDICSLCFPASDVSASWNQFMLCNQHRDGKQEELHSITSEQTFPATTKPRVCLCVCVCVCVILSSTRLSADPHYICKTRVNTICLNPDTTPSITAPPPRPSSLVPFPLSHPSLSVH